MLKLKNNLDSSLIIIALIQFSLIVYCMFFPQHIGLNYLIYFPLTILFYSSNFQCVTHNFIHNSFFKDQKMNNYFLVINSMIIGLPMTLHTILHENHHEFNNDRQDIFGHTTSDLSSIYRYSENQHEPESFWSYTFKSIFRTDFKKLFKIASERGLSKQVYFELIAILVFWTILVSSHFYCFIFYFIPTWFLGQCSHYASNYVEHYRSSPGNRLTDAVSCYSPWYNFVWFNNGYHQEHHFRPEIHWSEIKKLKTEMLPFNRRMIVKGSHWFNF